ncbi:MAG: T9SS type A sorting domain-containing protein [Aquaticitalea sp.]
MKKIYFLLFTILISASSIGQELIVNGDFETWTDVNTPAGYTHIENVEQVSTEAHTGTFSAKHTGGTSDLGQTITGVTPGTSYTISLWYKVDAGFGDGTDARIWSYWKNGATNVNDNADELRGPANGYFDANGNVWTQYSVTLTAPAGVDSFYFEVRTYGSAVVYWDDFSFFQESAVVPSISITSPANGATVATSNVNVALSVLNFAVANGTGDGHIQYTVDAGSVVNKYDTNPISLTGLTDGEHTVNVELVNNNNQPLSPAQTASVTFTVTSAVQVANLAALRADFVANGTGTVYQLMSVPTVTYTRANRNQKYIQDATAGILIDDSPGTITTSFAIGDGITGLVGTASEFNGVLQFVPSQNATVTAGATITPQVVSIATLLSDWENYESELVRINNATFADAGGIFAASSDYDLMDGATINFRTNFSEADYIGQTIPTGANPVVGFISEFGGNPQITARSMSDLTLSIGSFESNVFNVYPNPTSLGYVNITSNNTSAMTVSVFDVLGKSVLNQTISNDRLNVSTLKTGIYIVKISQDNATVTKKLVIR